MKIQLATRALHLGSSVQIDENDKEYFAFRTKFTFNTDKDDYVRERLLITSWIEENIVEGSAVGNKTLSVFDFICCVGSRISSYFASFILLQ